MKEVIIVIGIGCLMRINRLKGVVVCAHEKPEALIIPVNSKEGYDYQQGKMVKISGGDWMVKTLKGDFGLKNPIIVEEKAKTVGGAILSSRKFLEKENLLNDISNVIIFCQDGKEKDVKHRAERVFKGKEIQVYTFPK